MLKGTEQCVTLPISEEKPIIEVNPTETDIPPNNDEDQTNDSIITKIKNAIKKAIEIATSEN